MVLKYLILIFVLFSFDFKSSQTLIVGDSLSASINGWQDIFCNEKKIICVNLAKSGMKTDLMLKTMKTHLKFNSNYKQVFIYGGINDIFSYIYSDSVVLHIQKMVDLSNRYNIKPIVIVGYNSKDIIFNTWIKDKFLEAKIRNEYVIYQNKLQKSIKNAIIIPIITITKNDVSDGIHLNVNGHKKYVEILNKYIN